MRSAEAQAARLLVQRPGGRCETCKGIGTVVLEMHFLPDVEVACEECKGRRFRQDVLEVTYRGRNIPSILEMTADEAAHAFRDQPEIGAPPPTPPGGRPRLSPPRPADFDPLGRRGAATEARVVPGRGFIERRVGSSSSTSRRRASTRATWRGCSRALRALIRAAIRSSSSSTTSTSWPRRTGSSTWARGRGTRGAGRLRRAGDGILRCRPSITGRTLAAHLAPPRTGRSAAGSRPTRMVGGHPAARIVQHTDRATYNAQRTRAPDRRVVKRVARAPSIRRATAVPRRKGRNMTRRSILFILVVALLERLRFHRARWSAPHGVRRVRTRCAGSLARPPASEFLAAAHSKREQAEPFVKKGKNADAFPILEKAVADARLALAAAEADAAQVRRTPARPSSRESDRPITTPSSSCGRPKRSRRRRRTICRPNRSGWTGPIRAGCP